MKVYITADIEGITGVSHWNETLKEKSDYREFQKQMTAEVAAACKAANEAGAKEIWIKDAHHTGRNLIANDLPHNIKLIRGWSGNPLSMVQEIDSSFQAVIMIGYHSRANSSTAPLAHSMNTINQYIKINDQYVSEFWLHGHAAALHGVPVVFISGDHGICEEAKQVNSNIVTFPVQHGVGDSIISIHPQVAIDNIQAKVTQALKQDKSACVLKLAKEFNVEIRYKNHTKAYRASFYPGATAKDTHTIEFKTKNYFDVLRLISFVL